VLTSVVPFRGDAKQRLPLEIRTQAAIAMLRDVVDAALSVGRVIVVTNNVTAVPSSAEIVSDPGRGQAAAVSAGLAQARGQTLVINADLPLATPAALLSLARAGLALVAAPDGTTNALSLPVPASFVPRYGPESAFRFRSQQPYVLASIPELVQDVDTLDDLRRLAPLGGVHTRSLVLP
jgi:2-phospho-L-lactate guanylyltransferase (CobY/MobA/RfbA family)